MDQHDVSLYRVKNAAERTNQSGMETAESLCCTAPGCCRSALSPTAPKKQKTSAAFNLSTSPPLSKTETRDASMVCVHALRVYSSYRQHTTYQQHRHRGPGGVSREHQVAASAEVSQQRAHPGRHVVPSLRLVVIIQGLAVRRRAGERRQGHAQTPHQVRNGPGAN